MPIKMLCSGCRRRLNVKDDLAGRQIKCPACGELQLVPRLYRESDNLGTRQDTVEKATAYWIARVRKTEKEPFLLYSFATEESARAALLGVPCIHVAADSGRLICTETLTFGYYPQEETGRYEAVLAGKELTLPIFEKAKASFREHGGQLHGDGELAPKAQPTARPKSHQTNGQVTLVQDYTKPNALGMPCRYRVFRGPNEATAKRFLQQNPVTEPLVYLVVETPDGNWGRDIDGIYQE